MIDCKRNSLPLSLSHKLDSKFSNDDQILNNILNTEAIGSIMYAMVYSSYLAYAISALSRFNVKPRQDHQNVIKGVFLEYGKHSDFVSILGYTDSDFAKYVKFRRSITSYVFTIFGNYISWKSKFQFDVALSTSELEYIALTEGIKEGLQIRDLL